MSDNHHSSRSRGHLRVVSSEHAPPGTRGSDARSSADMLGADFPSWALAHLSGLLDTVSTATTEWIARRINEGLPVYLAQDGINGIVRQMPDGTKDIIEVVDGQPVVVQPLDPAP